MKPAVCRHIAGGQTVQTTFTTFSCSSELSCFQYTHIYTFVLWVLSNNEHWESLHDGVVQYNVSTYYPDVLNFVIHMTSWRTPEKWVTAGYHLLRCVYNSNKSSAGCRLGGGGGGGGCSRQRQKCYVVIPLQRFHFHGVVLFKSSSLSSARVVPPFHP